MKDDAGNAAHEASEHIRQVKLMADRSIPHSVIDFFNHIFEKEASAISEYSSLLFLCCLAFTSQASTAAKLLKSFNFKEKPLHSRANLRAWYYRHADLIPAALKQE